MIKLDEELESILSVEHWTDKLFSFTCTRRPSLRFRSGEFFMIGLAGDDGKPILRAYSVASAAWAEELEFYSIKVPDGPLTSRLQNIQPQDQLIVKPKAVGSLVLDALLPGRRLYLLATGTGFAPFASLLRDPETYANYQQIIVTHTCRELAELSYSLRVIGSLSTDPQLRELLPVERLAKILHYYPTTTREPSSVMGRITERIASGALFNDLQLPRLQPEHDRVMVCGSLAFNRSVQSLLQAAGFEQGSTSRPGRYVIERAFVG